MPKSKDHKERKRVVVEEVSETPLKEEAQMAPEATAVTETEPVEEIKEKVEELQGINDEISQSVEKSSDVQEEIVEAAEKVETKIEPKAEDFAPPRPVGDKGPSFLLIVVPGVLLLGALLGGIYFYQKGINQNVSESPTPAPTETFTPAPSASPSAKLDLTKYPVNVQNGSGIPGAAGTAKEALVTAGFKVSGTGNADNYDYTETVIKVKSDVPEEFITKLTSTLSKTYKVAAKTQTLPDTSKDKVVVIVGSSKAE